MKKHIYILLLIFTQINLVYAQIDLPDGYQTLTYDGVKKSSEGNIVKGKPEGYWTNFYKTGQLKSSGKWEQGQLDSIWIFYHENGKLDRRIVYLNNLKNGTYLIYDTSELISFEGYYLNDTLQGPFKKYTNGRLTEEGKYLNGRLNGKVLEYNERGLIVNVVDYELGKEEESLSMNRIKSGKKEGLWREFDANGKIISEKLYQNGQLIYSDLDTKKLFDFKKEYHENGELKTRYVVEKGKKQGIKSNFNLEGRRELSQIYENDSLIAEGWFTREGLKDSLWNFYGENERTVASGYFTEGKRSGKWVFYFENREIEQQGTYLDDLPTGRWLWYYPNGTLRREENFYRGKYEGEIKDFDSLGNLIQDRTYSYNIKEGKQYYFIGDHLEKGSMQNGLRQGLWVYRYNSKRKAFKGKYKDGLAQGKHKFWFDNGRRSFTIRYKNGKINGKKIEYYEEGGVNHIYFYRNNKLISIDNQRLTKNKD